MNSPLVFTWLEAKQVARERVFKQFNEHLKDIEIQVLQDAWEGNSYEEMAEKYNLSESYIRADIGRKLWKKLSDALGEKVTKTNFKEALQRAWGQPLLPESPAYPCGAVPLNSPYYISRPLQEKRILEEIVKPGALTRIKAPQEMGKTSLLIRILHICQQKLGYRTIAIDFQQADEAILSDTGQLLRWICVNSARQLGLPPKLDEFWDEILGGKMSWILYFEEYLLQQIDVPLVLAFDEVNQIFEHPKVAKDFLPLLRSCHEEGKRHPLWQKFRSIVVHSTEIYIPLQLEQSPFNVGLPIELSGFTLEQIRELAGKYGVNWEEGTEFDRLKMMIGGHPALLHLALYYLGHEKISLSHLLQTAATPQGIFSRHLQRHWVALRQHPELSKAFQSVREALEPIPLDPIVAYQLYSTGLIQLEGNRGKIACQLYRHYFDNY